MMMKNSWYHMYDIQQAQPLQIIHFGKKAKLHFLHGTQNLFATSPTCDFILRLPTCHDDYRTFMDKMTESICCNDGFGLV